MRSAKIVERPGRPIMSGLKTNPYEAQGCHNQDCPLMKSEGRCNNMCRTENILYMASCTRCQQTKSIYLGETSRTLGVRSSQHREDYQKASQNTNQLQEKSSFMWDHIKNEHGEVPDINIHDDFHFKILQRHKDPLTRQLSEAIRIEEALFNKTHHDEKGNKIKIKCLNRKEEHFKARKRFYEFDLT